MQGKKLNFSKLMREEAKPKQPIVGISLEPRELAELKQICGGESPGWVARQILYRWMLAVRDGRDEVPSRVDAIPRLPVSAHAPDDSRGGAPPSRSRPAPVGSKR